MRGPDMAPVPWDTVVFLAIASVGFLVTAQRFVNHYRLASRDFVAPIHSPELETPATLPLGCLEKAFLRQRFRSTEKRMALEGQFCLVPKGTQLDQPLEAVNLTTGQKGSVYFSDGLGFRTEPFRLQEGRNRIQLRWRETPEGPQRELTAEVVRSAPPPAPAKGL